MNSRTRSGKWLLAAILTTFLVVAPGTGQEIVAEPEELMETIPESFEGSVQDEVTAEISEKRRELLEEAVEAIAQSKIALAALDENKPDEALEALAIVTGKLDVIVARDPQLSLAPMDLAITTHDVLASVEEIEAAIDQSRAFLQEGRIQEARALLAGLGSEIIVDVTNIPLATYPDAIKAVVPLIDRGEIGEAKTVLQLALNTLVITENVIPLPIVRAQLMLEEANAILDSEERTVEQTGKLPDLVDAARRQFEMAEALGYAEEEDLAELYAEWDRVAGHITGESPEKEQGMLAKVQSMLAKIRGG